MLDELGSARKIIEVLQKELSIYPPTNHACGNVPVHPKATSKPVNSTEWTLVPARNYFHSQNKSNKHTNTTSNQTIKTANRFSLLPNLEVDNMVLHGPHEQNKSTPVQTTSDTKKHHNTGIKIPTIINGRLNYKENRNSTLAKKKTTRVSGPNPNTKEHKVRVVGDSHLKETAARIDQFLTSKCEVNSWIKPSAKTEKLVGTMENDFKCLEKSDVIVINGGANDVSSMRSQTINAVVNMARFVQKYNNTNIIIVNIPHRHDLDRTSVINSEIQAFNRQILKVAKAYSHVTIVEMDLDRKLFTRHGMHLNKRGKEWLAKLLATQISRLVTSKVRDAPKIALKWKDESAVNQYLETHMASKSLPDQTNITNNKIQIDTLHKETVVPRTSNRQKRQPITRNKDFLWKQ